MTTIYSVGHSNHTAEVFLALLRAHGIKMVVDVRSSPYSRYVPQANREALASTLEAAGIGYQWLGERLGGKPEGEVVDYDALQASTSFQEGVARLVAIAAEHPTTMMCAEGDHRRCHRHKLITPALLDRDVHVLHIQPDGSLVDEEEEPRQLSLF